MSALCISPPPRKTELNPMEVLLLMFDGVVGSSSSNFFREIVYNYVGMVSHRLIPMESG